MKLAFNFSIFSVMFLLLIAVSSFGQIEITFDSTANRPMTVPADFTVEHPKSDDFIPGQYIIVLKENETSQTLITVSYFEQQQIMRQEADRILNRYDISSNYIRHVYGSAIKGFSMSNLSDEDVELLRQDPQISYVEQDQVISLDDFESKANTINERNSFGRMQSNMNTSQVTPWGITRVGGGLSGSGKRAWIIDSGIDLDHPDLNVNLALSIDVVFGPGYDAEDDYGHGTHVAGTVAALDNGIGVVGVAAGAAGAAGAEVVSELKICD